MRTWLNFIRGIVRPFLTVVGFGFLTYGFVVELISADLYVPIVSMMVAFWFGQRNNSSAD